MSSTSATPLSVYGKLPLSKEFLRFRCNSGAAAGLYQWMNSGFDHSIRKAGRDGVALNSRWRLLFYADGMPSLVVGVIRDSADHGGLRRFPFACYTTVPRGDLPTTAAEQVAATTALWDELGGLDDQMSALPSLDALKESVRDAHPHYDVDPKTVDAEAALAAVPLAPVIEGIGGAMAAGGNAGRLFTSMLHEFAKAVRVLDSGRIPGRRLPALRLPVFGGSELALQATAWLRCLTPCRFLRERSSPVTIAIPEAAEANGSAWLVIRPPQASDFTMLGAGPESFFHPDPGGQMATVHEEPFAELQRRVEAELFGEGRTLADLARFRLV